MKKKFTQKIKSLNGNDRIIKKTKNVNIKYITNAYCYKIKKLQNFIKEENNSFMNILKNKSKYNYRTIHLSIYNIIILLLYYFILISLINSVISGKIYNKRKLKAKYIINLKVISGLKIKIVNSWLIPNRTYINGINSSIDSSGHVNIEKEGYSKITLEYDEKIVLFDKIFQNLENIVEVDLSNIDTSESESFRGMFINCENLEYVNFTNVNTSLINNMTSLFEGCISLKSIDMSNFNTSNVNCMDYMFKNCKKLTSLNLSNFKTPKLLKIKEMFLGCELLRFLDISNINTSLVGDMSYIFSGCIVLTSLNLQNFNTCNAKLMKDMFSYCSSLKSLDLSSFETSSVTDMSNMFIQCDSLISLNISSFDTSKVKNMEYMLANCYSLISLDLSSFITSKVEKMENMFLNCKSLISLDLSNFKFSGNSLEYFFCGCSSLESVEFSNDNKLKGSIDHMFDGCSSLKELTLSNFDFKLVKSMEYLFYGCIGLTSLDLSNINSESAINMAYMFSYCESLTQINFSNITTSSAITFKSMFENCISLKSLDLSSFNTSMVSDMSNLFLNCIKLTSLNLSSFDTSEVVDMSLMFGRCNSLEKLDLSNFNTSNVDSMSKMFFSCSELKSLDLSSFETTKASNLESMFHNCLKLHYINFYKFSANSLVYFNDIFDGTDDDLIICIKNESYSEIFLSELSSNQCITSKCPKNTINLQKKVIYDKKICIDDCNLDKIYKYEYDNFCYDKCPKGTNSQNDNPYFCQANIYDCIEEYPFLVVKDNLCVEDCNCKDFFNEICLVSNININSLSIIILNIIKGIQGGLMDHSLEEVISEEKKDIKKKLNHTLYHITSSFNQMHKKYNDSSSIILGECENILKSQYNISENETLIIFKTEKYIEGLLIPLIEYEIFNPETKEQLDLNKCKKSKNTIDILIPVKIKEEYLYKYDPNSSYYNDICNTYTSKYGTDITLFDRKNEFNEKKMALCFKNCEYYGYDSQHAKSICHCQISDRISLYSEINVLDLIFQFPNSPKITNFNILRCNRLLFSKEGLAKNFGSYLILLVLLLYIAAAFYIYFKGYNLLLIKINEILNSKSLETEKNSKKELNDFSTNFAPSSQRNTQLNSMHYSSKINNETKLDLKINDNNYIINNKNKNKQKDIKNENDHDIKYYDYEINIIPYQEAINIDKRTYFQYYKSLIKIKHIFIFSFNPNNDYNLYIIKMGLFLFYLTINIVINALFFNDSMMHRIYIDQGKYNFFCFLPKFVYTIIISSVIMILIRRLFLTQKDILGIKHEKNKNNLNARILTVIRCIIIKFVCFFIFVFLFLLLFWYYLSSFCCIYKNTQIYLIKNVLISLSISLIYPFIICLIPGIFRFSSLKFAGECFYKISQILQLF